jgi:ribosomal-protein-alanine N-acetyltransferase
MSSPLILPALTGDAVRLRAFTTADLPVVREAALDPLIPLITTVPARGDDDACLAYIARQADRLTHGVGYSFAIADGATDEAVGQIGLWLHDLRHGRVSTGYWVARPHRGRGLAADALLALSRWAVGLPGVARVELYVEPANTASRRTAERAGFAEEGLLRSWQRVGDERRDMIMYSLLSPGH